MVKELKGRERGGGGLLGYRGRSQNLSRRREKNGNGDNRTSDGRVSHAKVTCKEQDGTLEQICPFLEIGNEHHHLFWVPTKDNIVWKLAKKEKLRELWAETWVKCQASAFSAFLGATAVDKWRGHWPWKCENWKQYSSMREKIKLRTTENGRVEERKDIVGSGKWVLPFFCGLK